MSDRSWKLRSPRNAPTIGTTFSPERNSLNFLRLVLALTVLFSHAISIGDFGQEAGINDTTLGTVAVCGFFAISGYLIAKSAEANSFGRYLWQRFLRIMPAFWVCLIVTALFFGVLSWKISTSFGLSAYFNAPHHGPADYVLHNAGLKINQAGIAGTPFKVAAAHVWNGSLWTLFYEVICYAILGVAALLGLLKRRQVVLGLTVAMWLTLLVISFTPYLNHHFNVFENFTWLQVITLTPIFMTGSVVYLYRDRIPDAGWLAALLGAAFIGCLFLPRLGGIPAYSFVGSTPFWLFIVYPILWVGFHLPFTKVGRRNDYSYGIYIYAFPMQQLLAILDVQRWGYFVYALFGALSTLVLAMASWWVVERHALRLKHVQVGAFSIRSRREQPQDI